VKKEHHSEKLDVDWRIILKRVQSEIGLVTSGLRTASENTLFKERDKRREDEEEDVSSHWMTLRKE
jgi:hypothetical protein